MEKTTYSEPTTLWRLQHADGRRARSVVVPRGPGICAIWILNDDVEAARDFGEWKDALTWLETARLALLEAEWSDLSDLCP